MSKFKVKVVPLYEADGGLTARPGPTWRIVSADTLEEAMCKAGQQCGPLLAQDSRKPVALNVNVEIPA